MFYIWNVFSKNTMINILSWQFNDDKSSFVKQQQILYQKSARDYIILPPYQIRKHLK